MPQDPPIEIIIRDWQPGQAYTIAFVRPGEWRLSQPDLPPGAPVFTVIPGGKAAPDPQPGPQPQTSGR